MSSVKDQINQAYLQGYAEGHDQGYHEGRKRGLIDGVRLGAKTLRSYTKGFLLNNEDVIKGMVNATEILNNKARQLENNE